MPVDKGVVEEQLAQVPESARWAKRPEVALLPGILEQGEKIQLGVTGWVVESGKLAMKTWLVIATNERLLCLLGADHRMKKLQLHVSEMKSAHTDARLGYYEVAIEAVNRKLILSGLPKESAVALSATLSTLISRRDEVLPPAGYAAVPVAARTTVDAADLHAYVQKVERLEAELKQTKQRLAAVEQVIRNAQARAAAKDA